MQTIERATATDLTFISDQRYADAWKTSASPIALIHPTFAFDPAPDRALVLVEDVDLATAVILEALAPPRPQTTPGIHPSATIDPSATVDPTASIGPGCVIGACALIGPHCVLHANVTVMDQSRLGTGVILWPGVVIRERCTLGDGSILHPNVSIGADGFGYRPSPDGRGLIKIPQIGTVEIGRGVEIGANSCVDRGKFGPTLIGDGCKIDNLCQIGHNCEIGRCVIIAGCSGIAGSVNIGDGAMLAGQTGVVEHVCIGAGARVGAQSLVTKNVAPGITVAGSPAREATIFKRETVAMRRLPELVKQMRKT